MGEGYQGATDVDLRKPFTSIINTIKSISVCRMFDMNVKDTSICRFVSEDSISFIEKMGFDPYQRYKNKKRPRPYQPDAGNF